MADGAILDAMEPTVDLSVRDVFGIDFALRLHKLFCGAPALGHLLHASHMIHAWIL